MVIDKVTLLQDVDDNLFYAFSQLFHYLNQGN